MDCESLSITEDIPQKPSTITMQILATQNGCQDFTEEKNHPGLCKTQQFNILLIQFFVITSSLLVPSLASCSLSKRWANYSLVPYEGVTAMDWKSLHLYNIGYN